MQLGLLFLAFLAGVALGVVSGWQRAFDAGVAAHRAGVDQERIRQRYCQLAQGEPRP